MTTRKRLSVVVILSVMLQAVTISWGVSHAHAHDHDIVAQAEELRHSVLASSSDVPRPGHTHDDGDPHERVPGHLHGHNAFDHSHEAPSIITIVGVVPPAKFQQWNPVVGVSTRNGPPYLIEHPPKPI